jgi:hypothetical protein
MDANFINKVKFLYLEYTAFYLFCWTDCWNYIYVVLCKEGLAVSGPASSVAAAAMTSRVERSGGCRQHPSRHSGVSQSRAASGAVPASGCGTIDQGRGASGGGRGAVEAAPCCHAESFLHDGWCSPASSVPRAASLGSKWWCRDQLRQIEV